METRKPLKTTSILKIVKSRSNFKKNIMPSCNERKNVSGKTCNAAKIRHKKCGHIGCDSKGDCPSSLMTKVGRCRGCEGAIYIGDTERV